MPGVFGFVKGIDAFSIKSMQKAMSLYPSFKRDTIYEDEKIAASRVHLNKIGEKNSPYVLDDICVWVEGESYNVSELSNDFDLEIGTSFSKALLINYQRGTLDSFLNRLDGYFCAVIYDRQNSKLKLISDRYGMRMLYWYFHNEKFLWSSEVKGILALEGIDKTIDSASFNCFMELGHLLGTSTWFDKIKLINPASILSFDLITKEVSQHHYWTWAEILPSSLKFDEAVDELGKRFIRAVERRFSPTERIGVTLSGGLDSRAIVAAIDHLSSNFCGQAFTFGIEGCDDIEIARQVIEKTKWRHKCYHFTDDNWFKPRIQKVWNTDGMKDMMHMHGGEFVDDMATHVDVNLNGYLGDAIFGGSYIPHKEHIDKRIDRETAEKFYKLHDVETFYQSKFFDINHIDPYLFMSRGRRFINMGTVNSLVSLEQRKPFMDNECVELIYSLPDHFRVNNKLYSTMLQRFFPDFFKNIPWQQTGKPAGETPQWNLYNRLLKKFHRLFINFSGGQNKNNYTNYKNWILTNETKSYLSGLLKREQSEYSKLTLDDLKAKYLDVHGSDCDKSREVLRAATIELYLKLLNKNNCE
ncbi:hypothetical protein MTsDn1_29600 [Alteromonas sp. MTD1]|uniref:asparagine synthase-related protein n=1 Tax=Alteromonas sp. MTD1 TaxID=3057962 RepID=UPI0036F39EFB